MKSKKNTNIKPIFLLSLPRSGSTLVQRVLTSHPKIGSSAEPWLLLSLLGSLKDEGVYSWANSDLMRKAFKDFSMTLPNGIDTYRYYLRQFVFNLYKESSPVGTTYFLDKTPRYHLIVNELFETFEDAYFIFLWRHPMSVVSSLVESWGIGKWRLYPYEIDLFGGIENLISGFEAHRHKSYAVNYEKLVNSNHMEWLKLFNFLQLDMPEDLWKKYKKTNIMGYMGDAGAKSKKSIEKSSINKWKRTFNNPYRKWWAKRYLEWIGDKRLSLMGYDKKTILHELSSIPSTGRSLVSDVFFSIAGRISKYSEMRLILERLRRTVRGQSSYPIFPN